MNETQTRQFCTFTLGDLLFGVDVTQVQEVLLSQPLTRVPLASRVVRGLMNLRGQIVTAVDLRRRMDLVDQPDGTEAMNVVVNVDGGTFSLMVDQIGDVVEVDEREFELPPETLRGASRELIRGTYKLKDRLLLVLDTEQAVQQETMVNLA